MHNSSTIKFSEYRKLGELLNASFAFIKQEFKPLFKSMLVLALPLLILLGIVLGIFHADNMTLVQDVQNTSPELMGMDYITDMIIQYGLIIVIYYLSSTVISAIVLGYILEYINNGPQVPFENVLAQVKIYLPRLIAVNLVYYIIIMIGSMFFLIPGIFFGISMALSPIIIVLEDTGIVGSLKRSMYFINGFWWRTLGYLLVIGLIYSLVSFVFTLPTTILSVMQGIGVITSAPDSSLLLMITILVNIISTFSYLFSSLVVVFLCLYYFSQYELKEAGNLMKNIEEMAGNK